MRKTVLSRTRSEVDVVVAAGGDVLVGDSAAVVHVLQESELSHAQHSRASPWLCRLKTSCA